MRRKNILCVPSRGPSLTPWQAFLRVTARILAALLGSQVSFNACLFPVAGAQRKGHLSVPVWPFIVVHSLITVCVSPNSTGTSDVDIDRCSSGHVLSMSYGKEAILPALELGLVFT